MEESTGNKKSKFNQFFFDWIVPIFIAAILALLVQKFLLFKVYIPSESMVPTINKGDQLFVTKVYNHNKLKTGDIVVFESDELQDRLIKRLIGLPGDHISIVNGEVSVNGVKLEENYLGSHDQFNGEYDVPEGYYFFLGDNRRNSKDSRYFVNTYIPQEDILGKAQIRVYPFDNFGWLD